MTSVPSLQPVIARSPSLSAIYLLPCAPTPQEVLDAGVSIVAWNDPLVRARVTVHDGPVPDFSERIVLILHRTWPRPIRDREAADPFLVGMTTSLRDGFRRGIPPSEADLEEIARRLGDHLERFYARPRRHRDKAGLSAGRLAKARAFIEDHLTEAVPLAALAEAASLSLFHFGRMFQRSMGVSPAAYMVRRRLEAAEELLAQTSLPIAEVSARAGFRTQAHFCTAFRRLKGVTPSRSRRNARLAAQAGA